MFVDLDVHQGECTLLAAWQGPGLAPAALQRAGCAGTMRRRLTVTATPGAGDGTAAIFSGDPTVFTFSMHCSAQVGCAPAGALLLRGRCCWPLCCRGCPGCVPLGTSCIALNGALPPPPAVLPTPAAGERPGRGPACRHRRRRIPAGELGKPACPPACLQAVVWLAAAGSIVECELRRTGGPWQLRWQR
jgi:hypothetical protein